MWERRIEGCDHREVCLPLNEIEYRRASDSVQNN